MPWDGQVQMPPQRGQHALVTTHNSSEPDVTFLADANVADALGASLRAAFAPVLEEPIPTELLALLKRFETFEADV